MSLDPLPIYIAANRWKKANFAHLPRTQIEPVIWVGDDDRLKMYHPAMQLDIRTPAKTWTPGDFAEFVSSLLPDACELIEKRMLAMGMPSGFYSAYPEHARVGMTLDFS